MDNVTALQAIVSKDVVGNTSNVIPDVEALNIDTSWVLTSTFVIFTIQTGFGMLESGCVSVKNEVNILMKNIVDIGLGGFTYWLFGYGFSYGHGSLTNPFIGLGDFLVDPIVDNPLLGQICTAFLFQLSFATTATTIVGGAMAERTNFKAYCMFSLLNTAVYCIPAGWVWGDHGFLNKLGVVDIAGGGPVHLIGGGSAFAAAVMLGPRLGRYANGYDPLPLGNPVHAVLGMFLLWWGWLAFNSGSTYGVSGAKWQYCARAAVTTMLGSFGGGICCLLYTMWRNKGKVDIIDLINGILGSLVSITAGCFLYRSWEALIIGGLGALLCCAAMPLLDRLGVDDPVGASAVHGVCGIWGLIAIGLFADNPLPLETTKGRMGLFKGGGWELLGIQVLSALCLTCWGVCVTFLLLFLINKIIPIRMDPDEELLGADFVDHKIRNKQIDLSQLVAALAPLKNSQEGTAGFQAMSVNAGYEQSLEDLRAAEEKIIQWRMQVEQMNPTKIKNNFFEIDDGQMPVRRKVNSISNNYPEEHTVENGVGGVFKSRNPETQ